MTRRGYAFNRTADMDTARRIKEDLCFVSYDVERDRKLADETTNLVRSYTLPDGRVITLGAERFAAPEALFNPELVDVEGGGIHEAVFRCVQENDIDNRMLMYQRIVLSGGSSMYPGLPRGWRRRFGSSTWTRCSGDVAGMRKLKLKIEDPPRRKHMVFMGGAVLADIMRNKPEFWVSKAEYEEHGVDRCLQKVRHRVSARRPCNVNATTVSSSWASRIGFDRASSLSLSHRS